MTNSTTNPNSNAITNSKTMHLVQLKFETPFSSAGLDKTEGLIQSDMLISALAVCHLRLWGVFNPAFFSEGCRVSSLFPYYENRLFFPVPLYPVRRQGSTSNKSLQQVQYLEESLWRQVIAGEGLTNQDLTAAGNCCLSRESFPVSQTLPKGGLFFLADIDPMLLDNFMACLRLLGDEGIGGDSTVGKGLFKIEKISLIELPDFHSDYFMSLSFFIPSATDCNAVTFGKSFYRLQRKKGWFNTYRLMTVKKKSVRGFAEGSVFFSNKKLNGKSVTLKSAADSAGKLPFDILRNGHCLAVPVNLPVMGDG